MSNDVRGKFDNYSISPRIRQTLLHWGYELTEKGFFINSTNQPIKMSKHQNSTKKKYHKKQKSYSKEKGAGYYLVNKEARKEKSKNQYKNLSKEEKDKIKEYQRKRYQQLIQYKKEALQNK